ncbi:MAG: hypothetical protein NVS4B7_14930 [Ktedonobacteraceae bacterium]
MPIQRSHIRRDGHDHLRRATDEVDTEYPRAPRRVPRTNVPRPVPTTDEMSDEVVTPTRIDYDTQGIITLESKTRQRQQGNRAVPTRQPSNRLAPVKQPAQQSAAMRQPTQQSAALRQPTQPSVPTKRPSQYIAAKRLEPQRQFHWLVPTGITMMITIACYLLLYVVWTGGRGIYNDLSYGTTTRTSHLEAVVGDHDSATSPTHFAAMNLHGNIDVIEFPGGDVTHAKVFPGPHLLWSNADKAVVTLEVKDVNGDNKPDILVHVQGDTDLLFRQTTANFVLHNTGSGFSPMSPIQS